MNFKQTVRWIWLTWKRILSNPALIIILGIIIGAGAVSGTVTKNDNRINIALYDSDNSWNQYICQKLAEEDGGVFLFHLYEDENKLIQDITSEKMECGFIFPENFKNLLNDRRYQRTIRMICSPSTVTADLAAEKVFSAIFKEYSKDLLKDYIQNSGIYDNKENAWNEILSLSEIYLNNGSVFDFKYKNIEGRKVEIEVISYKRLCKEICMIGIFIAGIISSMMTAQDDKNKLFSTIKKNQKYKYQIIQIYAVILLFTVIYVISFSLNKSYINIKEYIFILFYGIACAIYSYVLLKAYQKPEFLASVTIIASVICVICCPVIMDFSLYCPYLKLIRWVLPPWYYYVMI